MVLIEKSTVRKCKNIGLFLRNSLIYRGLGSSIEEGTKNCHSWLPFSTFSHPSSARPGLTINFPKEATWETSSSGCSRQGRALRRCKKVLSLLGFLGPPADWRKTQRLHRTVSNLACFSAFSSTLIYIWFVISNWPCMGWTESVKGLDVARGL